MKTKTTLLGLLLLGVIFSSVSCSDDDDNDAGKIIPQPVREAFAKDYPNAADVNWDIRLNYYVAEFYNAPTRSVAGKPQTEAWYNGLGNNEMEKEEIETADFASRYGKVYQAWENDGKYGKAAGFVVDEVEFVKRGAEERVVVEVEKGEVEYDLTYSLEGELLKARLDEDGKDEEILPIPDELKKALVNRYGKSVVFVEFEQEGSDYELELLLPAGFAGQPYFKLEQEITYVLKDGKLVESRNEIDVDEEEMAMMLSKLAQESKEVEAVVMKIFGLEKPAPWTEDDIENLNLSFVQDVKSYDVQVKKGDSLLFTLLLNKEAQKNYVYEMDMSALPL